MRGVEHRDTGAAPLGFRHRDAPLTEIWKSIGGDRAALTRVSFSNEAFSLPSAFAVSDLPAASVAATGLALSELVVATQESRSDSTDLVPVPAVEVDRRLASLWFSTSLRPIGGWAPPPLWDSVAGGYCASHARGFVSTRTCLANARLLSRLSDSLRRQTGRQCLQLCGTGTPMPSRPPLLRRAAVSLACLASLGWIRDEPGALRPRYLPPL